MPTEAERLHLLYDVSRRLATIQDLPELLGYATDRARELFRAEGCALLLCDRSGREFHFHAASSAQPEVQKRLDAIRFPTDRGIAGWVLAHGESVMVKDTATDARFYQGVDDVTSTVTRSVLCAPLRTGWGIIGVIEVVNAPPESLTADDLTFLEALATDIAVAHEKVALGDRLRGEVGDLRQACRMVGAGLVGLGIVLVGATVLGHFAWALPLGDLFARPGLWAGIASGVAGATLWAIGRGRLVGATPAPRL